MNSAARVLPASAPRGIPIPSTWRLMAVWVACAIVSVGGNLAAEPIPLDRQRQIRIVALQAGDQHSRQGDRYVNPGAAANFDRFARLAREAVAAEPAIDLIVFPEYAISGSPYPSEATLLALAEAVPGDGHWFGQYQSLARELSVPLVGWMLESDQGRLYNCAFILDADGQFVGKYRKVHANLGEQTWWGWSQGDAFVPIELDGVRYGISICSDMWFPETVLANDLLGADVIVHLSVADDMQAVVPARALDSQIPIVMSIFEGGSYAVDAAGSLLGKLAADEPGWIAFELKPFQRHLGHKYGGVWDTKLGRRNVRQPPAYAVITDPTKRPPWTSIFMDNRGTAQSRSQLVDRFGGRYDANEPSPNADLPLVSFPAPWTSPYRVDPQRPYQLVNGEDQHLFILNKTAWAYFACDDPQGVLDRARSQGVNVLRVALEGVPYWDDLAIDLWPWGGSRQDPDWTTMNEPYWAEVQRRVRLAGDNGIGLDLVLYMELRPELAEVPQHQLYWQETLRRLGCFANVLTWEITNEYTRNETFQDQAGTYLKQHDRWQRPVCSSDGTSDDALWPDKPWMDLAINHTCTSSTKAHDLQDWYLALARNTRGHGKPAFCNESGREVRHGNDDGVHRRKQGWLWCAAGGFWTWHSWDGCEGINDLEYRAPGEQYLRPLADFFRDLPFGDMNPNFTACVATDRGLVQAALSTPDRSHTVAYVCTRASGETISDVNVRISLPAGRYQVHFHRPSDGQRLQSIDHRAGVSGTPREIALPAFEDDLVVTIIRDVQE